MSAIDLTPPIEAPGGDQAETVLSKRYYAPGEDWEGLVRRVALNLANGEKSTEDLAIWFDRFYHMMMAGDALPNSPTLMNAGLSLQQLSACFVLPVGDSTDSIFRAVHDAAVVHKSGGGTGFDFSNLRPRGSSVSSTQGVASGPVGFIDVFDTATGVMKQGGKRRGANMGILRCDHPDILEFVKAKLDGTRLQNFNISVGITDEFMEAVEGNNVWFFRWGGQVYPSISARELWEAIISTAWKCGDPGLVFLDRINRDNPNPHLGEIAATNPCGEQPLLPNESCNLGSVNLANHVTGEGQVDWIKLENTLKILHRMLDNVVSMNKSPTEAIGKMMRYTRRIGVGVMGFADALILQGIAYDSEEGLVAARLYSSFIKSVLENYNTILGNERGAYPAYQENHEYGENIDNPRNSAPYTIAPTGTISVIAGCSSGIEPLYALAVNRQMAEGDDLSGVHPLLRDQISEGGCLALLQGESLESLLEEHESFQPHGVPKLSLDPTLWKTAHEIPWTRHIEMQAAWQEYCHNAVSKTINLPFEATKENIDQAYWQAYMTGCKGITVFRDGSKPEQVLRSMTKPVNVGDEVDDYRSKSPLLRGSELTKKRGQFIEEANRRGVGKIQSIPVLG